MGFTRINVVEYVTTAGSGPDVVLRSIPWYQAISQLEISTRFLTGDHKLEAIPSAALGFVSCCTVDVA